MLSEKNLAFYIRLSSEDDDLKSSDKTESNSITNQRKLLADYYHTHPELHMYNIVEFCDDGFSGTNFERPRFMAMMQLVQQEAISAIIVKDLSRFGRDFLEVGAYLELILPLFGTRFISVNDNFDSDNFIGTTGGVEMALRNLINSMYSKDLSVKIKSANRTRNHRGDYWGGAAFYGYSVNPKDKHKLIIDTKVSDIVVRIFHECIAGNTAAQIAKRLNDDGILSPAKYKHVRGALYNGRIVDSDSIWTASTVLRILKDERYTGKMITNKRESVGISTKKMRALPREKWIVVEGTHEAIIPQSVFDEAATARTSRIKTVNRNTGGYRANNLFVCGHCGRKLQKTSGSVTHLFCLKAGLHTDSPCKTVHEPIEALQEQVLKAINSLAVTLIDHIEEFEKEADREISSIETRITEASISLNRLQGGKLELYEDYRLGRITRDRFLTIQNRRQRESDRLNANLKKYEDQLKHLKQKFDRMKRMVNHSKELVMLKEYCPDVIRGMVKQIKVYGEGRIEIDLLSNDDFILNALAYAKQLVG